jgi:PQQ-dependent dehydrogenase (methanol/ethanol family)
MQKGRLESRNLTLSCVALIWVATLWIGTAPLLAAQASNMPDAMQNPFASDPAAVTAGKTLYEQTCQNCHGAEAAGDRGPALTGNFRHGSQDTDLYQSIRMGFPGTQMPGFSFLPTDSVWKIITYLRSLDGNQNSNPEKVDGDSTAGEKLFFGKAGCAQCHEINGKGSIFAGDLSAIGVNPVSYLRGWVESPSTQSTPPSTQSSASKNNRGGGGGNSGALAGLAEMITTRNGEHVQGIRIVDDHFTLLIRDTSGAIRRFESSQIFEQREDRKPLMPEDYSKTLSSTERQDLIAYLAAQKFRDLTKTAQAHIPGGVTPQRLENSGKEPQNWLSYWGSYRGSHFAPLTQITPANVKQLSAQWAVQMPGASVLEATPLVVDGILYTSGPPGEVYALDAKTGLQIWKYERRQKVVNPYETNPFSRGIAILGNRLFVGTLDAALVALDARTGRELWETQVADTMQGYTITAAPLAVKDKIIVGVAGGEFGIRGFLDAYDASTGKRLWRFNTIPGPGEFGNDTWPGDSWKRGSGATWLTGSYDPQLNTLYWTVGNPSPGLNSSVREGDNLFTCSVLALDPDTGTRKWHYQFTPEDTHDWDANEDVILADQSVNGIQRKVLLHADRNGMFYTLDRTSGKFISATPYVKQSWNNGFDANGRPIFAPGWKSSPEGAIVSPSLIGGANWQNPSYDAERSTFFVIAHDGGSLYRSGPTLYEPGRMYWGGAPGGSHQPGTTNILAIDTLTGKIRWNYSLVRPSFAAGVLSTRTGLLFASTGEGNILALESNTGKPLWHFHAGGNIASAPMSYSVDGKQYIALAAGNVLYSFALPN